MSRFDICLAQILTFESGYKQQPGGPFKRHANGSAHIPDKPDGMAFDDDPNDTGGRTCMGILQRVYDAWRDRMGLARRDVWLIEDREIAAIYKQQYWQPLRCDELPPGIDLAVFDTGVNCGIGMGAKILQRALGLADDGHIGTVTLAAAQAADAAATVEAFKVHRDTYYRACRTFKHHGKNWLKRSAASCQIQLAMLAPNAPAWPAADVVVDFAEHSRSATPPPAASSVAETSTSTVQTAQIALGSGVSLTQGLEMAERVERMGFVQTVLQSPVTLALIAVGLVIACGGIWQLRDRARKLILGV